MYEYSGLYLWRGTFWADGICAIWTWSCHHIRGLSHIDPHIKLLFRALYRCTDLSQFVDFTCRWYCDMIKERLASETESNTGPEIRNCWHLHVYKANIDGKICRFNEALTYGRIYFVSYSCLYTYNASSRSLKQQLLVSCKCLNHEHTCRFLSDVKTLWNSFDAINGCMVTRNFQK